MAPTPGSRSGQRATRSVSEERETTAPMRCLFGQGYGLRLTDIKDGTSHTTAFNECTLRVVDGGTNAWAYRGWVMVGVNLYGKGPYGINQWAIPAAWTWLGTTAGTPGSIGTTANWGCAASLHPGGCQSVFADGSVHFISEATDLVILQYLGYISDDRQTAGF
ncbi:MAG TPA: DUF1559 domain-containing protein [Pirellulales bacterium]